MKKRNDEIDPLAWLASAHEQWKKAVLKKAEEMYEDNDELQRENKNLINLVTEMSPPLPWVVSRQSDLDRSTQKKTPIASPHDFLVIARDGNIVARIPGQYDDAADMIAKSGQMLCDVAFTVHDAMEAIDNSFADLQYFYEEEIANNDSSESFEDKYYRTLSWIRTFVAANNSFSPIIEVGDGGGILVNELFHPEEANSTSGIQWGVWEVEDPDLEFKFWVGGWRIIDEGKPTQGELHAYAQAETEGGDDAESEDFKTIRQMRRLVAQITMPIQLEIGIPIHPNFEEWIESGEIGTLMQ